MQKKHYISLFLVVTFIISSIIAGLYFVKYNKPSLRIKVINNGNGKPKINRMLRKILEERYNVKFTDQNYNMIFDNPYGDGNRDYDAKEAKDSKIIKIFFTPEAVLPNLDNYDLVIGFNNVDDLRFIRTPWYYMQAFSSKIDVKYSKINDQGKCKPVKQHFACFLVSNNTEGNNWRNHMPFDGCMARANIFNKLSKYKPVVSGGKVLNNIGIVIPQGETMGWLSKCKFVIAYENQTFDGYITEKPFQAYFAGSIPIYYGAKSAVQDINKKAIIYANDFTNEDDLVEYIKKVDNDDDLYCDIWNQNIIENPDRNFEIAKDKLRKKLFEVIDSKLNK